jgi:hypothetical protein
MRPVALMLITLAMAGLFVLYGVLLAWNPRLFLRFHDTFVDRSRWNRNAPWRKDLDSLGAKIAAASFVMFGLLLIYVTLPSLMSALQ